jgi:hypothetical protein
MRPNRRDRIVGTYASKTLENRDVFSEPPWMGLRRVLVAYVLRPAAGN